MTCSNPLLALKLLDKSLEGNGKIKILPRRPDMGFDEYAFRYGKDNLLLLPCGHCPSCLSRRSKEWAVRCALEALDHEENCFITLTYDSEHYPGEAKKSDLQAFVKCFRNHGYKIRYFGCCERGDQFNRFHFHIIIFGYFPKDAIPWLKSKSGFMQYKSEEVSSFWNKGIVTVAEFHPFTAQYVAGYVVKKLSNGDKSFFHIQSTRPGIGAGYVLRNIQEIYSDDKLILNFGSHLFSVPRYFDKLAEYAGMDLSDIKASRLEASNMMTSQALRDHGFIATDQMLVHNESIALSKIHFKKRSF